MEQKDIDKIAQAIAAKLAEPGGNQLLGCGDASSSQDYECGPHDYECWIRYECGGAGDFHCSWAQGWGFYCYHEFDCSTRFGNCRYIFRCDAKFN